ncbi:MAG TPA: hypothetical protein VK436_09500 [Methanocella sp.]|nr:hypothetical protein [Methanocella sp.]
MVGKKRERGERESVGVVKAAILLYLADNGERTFTDIRSYLRDRYGIITGKIARTHLQDLSNEQGLGLLTKSKNGNGNADSYKIKDGFASLKSVYNFLKAHGSEGLLMKTRYFLDETGSIKFLISVKMNFLRNATSQCHDSIVNDGRYAFMKRRLDRTSAKDRKILVDWMDQIRMGDESNALVKNYFWVMGCIEGGNMDKISRIVMDRLLRQTPDGAMVIKEEYGIFFSPLGVSDHYRERIVAIVRQSPGALDYVLNSTGNSAIFPPDPVQAYAMNLLLRHDRAGEINLDHIIDIEACRRYMEELPRYISEPLIFEVAKSLLISDMIYGRTIEEDIPAEQLKLIFSEN